MKNKNIVILGSTGSIGTSSLDVINNLSTKHRVLALSANKNYKLFLRQITKFKPIYAVISDICAYTKIKSKVPNGVKLLQPNMKSLEFIASLKSADLIIHGLVGAVGLSPLVCAIKQGKTIALANKEPIVIAGSIIMKLVKRYKAKILPVDSEPSAVFQCLQEKENYCNDKEAKKISKIFLTASGGPFFNYRGDLSKVSAIQALQHPRWTMGNKITIDSSTLVNKGFEAIEMCHLFNVPMNKVEIVIHPQSIIHGAIEYQDGSIISKMSNPDMRLPIQYAITYPNKIPSPVKKLNLFDIKKLEFYKPNFEKFKCLNLILQSYQCGGFYPTIVNASNEIAVEEFIKNNIKFTDIYKVVKYCFDNYKLRNQKINIVNIVKEDRLLRIFAKNVIKSKKYEYIN